MWNWERALTEAKAFFQSGLFYILFGCIFLWMGFRLSANTQTHSAFVFIIVILGVALVLYGTGTNATGEGTSGAVKVAIAGGAGVLAMLLGFGVVSYREGLVEVFKRQRDYGVINLTIAKESGIPVDLSTFEVKARLAGHVPLPLWNDNQTIEIFVPIPDDMNSKTDVFVKLTPKSETKTTVIEEDQNIPVIWSSDEVDETVGFANEKIRIFRKPLVPLKPKELSVQSISDQTNLMVESFTISPE